MRPGDLVTLSGELGAGKTTFARALIRDLVGDPDLEVPSPTFTLIQVYESHARDTSRFPIVHADLFRIKDPSELAELGWEEASEGALVIVEWPERASGGLAGDRLDIAFHLSGERGSDARAVAVTGIGAFGTRLTLSRAIREIFSRGGFADATRTFMMGDASTRAYERLAKPDGTKAILMISPPRPDGPAIRYGKPYSAIAHLAEDIRPYLAIGAGLRELGFSAPVVLAHDTDVGLAIIEDLGADLMVDAAGDIIVERYTEAVAALARLHAANPPKELSDGDGGHYAIPPYDLEALTIEVELLPEWYAPHIAKVMPSSGAKAGLPEPLARGFHRYPRRPHQLDPARLSFAEPAVAGRPRGSGARRHDRFSGLRAGPPGLRRRLAPPGCPGHGAGRRRTAPARPLRPRAARAGRELRHGGLRQGLRDPRRPARDQDPGNIRAARQAGPQTAISPSHPTNTNVPAQESSASGLGGA